jgi:hypothetical protein
VGEEGRGIRPLALVGLHRGLAARGKQMWSRGMVEEGWVGLWDKSRLGSVAWTLGPMGAVLDVE